MNICVITPLYPIVGRDDIKTDTQAIHLLLKYLVGDNNIHVFNISRISPRHVMGSFFKKGENLNEQYDYTIDGINATLLRYRAFPKQKMLTQAQINKVQEKIKITLNKNGFCPDVVVVHIPSSFPGITSGLFEGIKRIAVLHRTDINIIASINKLSNMINQQYDVISSRSRSVQKKAYSLSINIDEKIAFSGIPEKFLDKSHIHVFGNLNRKMNLLYVGKLIKRKHPEYLISLCEYLNGRNIDTSVTIIGDGPLKKSIGVHIEKSKYKNKITTISSVDRSCVQKFMRDSDVFILPSVNETLGLVYLEAMAAGCITIGVMEEGIDGIIKNGENGFLIKPENYCSLETCLDTIVRMNNSEIQRMSLKAIETACSCPENMAANNYLKIMKEKQEQYSDDGRKIAD